MAANGKQLDTSVNIVTPENIAFRYRLAGPFRRLPAYLLDLLIRGAVMYALSMVLGITGMFGLGFAAIFLLLLAAFVLEWFYGGVLETYWNGQTVGKWAMGIRVVSTDGQPISGWQAVLRNFLRIADAQPFWLYQAGLLTTLMTSRFQRLGDLAAGTMVIVEERHWLKGMVHFAEPEVARLASLVPPNFVVTRSLATALAAYVERRPMFTWARRLEIARHLAEPLRQRFGLPPNTNPDYLLCGLYQRSFLNLPTEKKEGPIMAEFAMDPYDPLAWIGQMATTGGRR